MLRIFSNILVSTWRRNLQLYPSCITCFHDGHFPPIDMSIKEKLVGSLQELKSLEYADPTVARDSNNKAEKALFLIFQAGRRHINFTESEKRQVGNLIAEVIKPIQINIVSTSFRDRSRLDSSVLQKRSALQFLVEDYAQFPAKDSVLLNQLEQVNIKESIKILDNLIEYWRDISDADEGDSDRESAGASDMPVVGHVKGVIHYAAGDSDGGNRAMYQASRTTAVVAGSVAGGVLGGPAGAVGGAVYAGSMTDLVVSAASQKPQGIVQHCENVADDIKKGKNPTISLLTTTVHVGLDAAGGLGMGGLSSATAKSVSSEVAANVGKGMIEKSVKISAEEAAKFTVRKATETVAKKTAETVIKKTAEKVMTETAEIVAVQAFTAIAYTAERAALESIDQQKEQIKKDNENTGRRTRENSSQRRRSSGTGSGSGSQPPQGNRDGSQTRRGNSSNEFAKFLELLKEILDSICSESFGKRILEILKNLEPGQIDYLMKLIKGLNYFGTTKIVLKVVIKIFFSNNQLEFTFTNFLSWMEFVKTYINNIIEKLSLESLGTGESPLNVSNEQRRASLIEAVQRIPDLPNEIFNTFVRTQAEIEAEVANEAVIPNFRDIFSAVYHYFKHKIVPGDGILSVREYYGWIRRLLQRVRALPEYSDLQRGRIPRNEIIFEMYVAVFGRRIRIVIKKYSSGIVLASCYVVTRINENDEEGHEFVNGERRT